MKKAKFSYSRTTITNLNGEEVTKEQQIIIDELVDRLFIVPDKKRTRPKRKGE